MTDEKSIAGIMVGMPDALLLEDFGYYVIQAFGKTPYLVGSVLQTRQWRDVDVRLILYDEEYASLGLGDPKHPHCNGKWVSLTLAFAVLGKTLTGLPIDFQIQQQTYANALYRGPRSAIGIEKAIQVGEYTRAREQTLEQ
jgi:hypothetical protein